MAQTVRKAKPSNIHARLTKLRAGMTLELKPGSYRRPLVVSGKSGTQAEPIVIRGEKARLGPETPYEDYRIEANRLSAVQEAGGRYPGVYYLADDAMLILRDCQWVVVEDLEFDGCWPTAIYIDNCQHITLRGLDIRGGTFAIGATGTDTRHLLIEDCTWLQDVNAAGERDIASIRRKRRLETATPPDNPSLWGSIDWEEVHGTWEENQHRVDIDADHRGFDGDFFRAWTIAGYVIIRNNIIADAFNAVHFFNTAAASIVTDYCRNVLIEGNWFIRIRDNAIEPEDFAWNWTIRHNRFVDCYIPFSFEMQRSGYFYLYGNLGWNPHRPGPPLDDHTRGQLFKFPTVHAADGPHYVFNNSWMLRSPLIKKRRFSHLVHVNNAIDYYDEDGHRPPEGAEPFGPDWQSGDTGETPEEGRFTRQWEPLSIRFDADVVGHPHFPDALRQAGYPIGPSARGIRPDFADTTPGVPKGLRTTVHHPAERLEIALPDGQSLVAVDTGAAVGAWQGNRLISVDSPPFVQYWPEPNLPKRSKASPSSSAA
ncbi:MULTISPECIES: right-handed parallel beta-helix repeat-containing protein [unclassified Rhizobium]|uniref:right-handed parallel beta-helix repeat-containing protein n=1 Tax=unclassified Rhizobium TaxID=2613769 RepID=UPI0006FB3129|nr:MULTISPECIES: right-handed parallel beta-helix repeat-containing protein [unclassified Rhizobium]KQV33676.1 hypothetical protein ASC86_16925 [Rhizobium sp. Root1212]KRD23220.1 hypothetical protein ASE37_16845 [Rhizobium sp. Root268]